MAASSTTTARIAEPPTVLPIHRLDVDTYNRMVACGALEGQRVELLDGVLVEMSPLSPAHNAVVTRLMRHFAATPRWWMQVQSSIEVPPDAEPEPDLVLAAHEPPPGRHLQSALLVIEVAVSSHMIDRDVKAKLYAGADIPTYWLVDVPGRTVEVYTEPAEQGCEHCERFGTDRKLPCALEGVADVDISALFEGIDG